MNREAIDFMETEIKILEKDLAFDIRELDIPEITDEEMNLLLFYIEVTRFIQEIEKLYQIYKCNLNILLDNYILYSDDTIEGKFEFKENDYIRINTLVINLIGSGKTLVESIENFIDFINDCIDGQNNEFKKECLSKLYDENFSYRLLLFLRNYSQHGHLAVNSDFDNKYCFDLDKILSAPHFKIKKSLEKEITEIAERIYEEFNRYPRIMFTKVLAEYNLCVHQIYYEFLDSIEQCFYNIKESVNELLDHKSELICREENELNGFVVFRDEWDEIHCFNANEKSDEMLNKFKDTALRNFENEKAELEKFNTSLNLIIE